MTSITMLLASADGTPNRNRIRARSGKKDQSKGLKTTLVHSHNLEVPHRINYFDDKKLLH